MPNMKLRAESLKTIIIEYANYPTSYKARSVHELSQCHLKSWEKVARERARELWSP